jgi:uncharacterized protein (TIGR00297 family)
MQLPATLISQNIWAVALLTSFFAVFAYWLRGVSISGAIAGWIVSFILYAASGAGTFVVLLLVFFLTWAATKLGYQRKQQLGTAEKKGGRAASQVFANLGLAAACAAAYYFSHGNLIFLLALIAALAEATADTVSSELGQAFSKTARIVTSWKQVAAGTDGAISLIGTCGGVGAAIVISVSSALIGLFDWLETPGLILAAVVGMICDSYLGATLQRRGLLNNNLVNLLSTLSAALVIGIFHIPLTN